LNIKSFSVNYNKILQRIILIESIYKSDNNNAYIERLNISNSKKYLEFFKKKNLNFLFELSNFSNEEIYKNKPNFNYDKISNEILGNIEKSESLKKEFIKKHFEFLDDLNNKEFKDKDKKNFEFLNQIKPEEIFIKIFSHFNEEYNQEYLQSLNFDSNTESLESNFLYKNYNYNINFNECENKNKQDINLKAFLSTMNFLDYLCFLCKDTFKIPQNEQIIFLRREISELNKELPANVYVPFLNNSIRNNVIVHLPISELKIFRTKTRVLYMTTVEMVRIDEIHK